MENKYLNIEPRGTWGADLLHLAGLDGGVEIPLFSERGSGAPKIVENEMPGSSGGPPGMPQDHNALHGGPPIQSTTSLLPASFPHLIHIFNIWLNIGNQLPY